MTFQEELARKLNDCHFSVLQNHDRARFLALLDILNGSCQYVLSTDSDWGLAVDKSEAQRAEYYYRAAGDLIAVMQDPAALVALIMLVRSKRTLDKKAEEAIEEARAKDQLCGKE